jgi:excisionase family DNA binding protein
MTPFDAALRAYIVGIVREELARAIADVRTPEEYLTTRAAAHFAGVAMGTIRRWVREGRLPEHRAGRVVRVRRADLERLLADGRRKVVTATPEELARRAFS